MQTPTVFVSYTHDDDRHRAQVRGLVDLLAAHAIRSKVDYLAGPERRDWWPWARTNILECEYTLVIASPQYRRMGDGSGPNDKNLGGQCEASLLRDMVQSDRAMWTRRILPVVLPGRSIWEIPDFLQPCAATHFVVDELTMPGITNLYRTLTGQPQHTAPELGKPLELPPESGPGSSASPQLDDR
ncbi:toll/interleukin-1 receptor domain-containing protein [Saccharopolyspora shandongensis]|uniref:toll/interleukin-1 receptor domain-containing protein n=1 Tax=Saccharopolyspora shandongensis TaxID=418495 RepID=UPI00343993E8